MPHITLHQGHAPDVLSGFPANHFSACVTDPPYELGFMGKKWDSTGISYSVDMWREVLRVLKPGAHLLAFGGSRTYHRMACAIEDAGFEVRDQIMWLYGSGFPKSLDVSKAIDKAAGAEREVVGKKPGRCGKPKQDIRGGNLMSGTVARIDCSALTIPATDLARQWDGWGTALKPAHEPIVVARKPLKGTVIENVLKWGCGAINVGASAVEIEDPEAQTSKDFRTTAANKHVPLSSEPGNYQAIYEPRIVENCHPLSLRHKAIGRFPANVIHDGSDEVMAEFAKYGERRSGSFPKTRNPGARSCFGNNRSMEVPFRRETDAGSAARFFYCAKASSAERNLGCEGLAKKRGPVMSWGCVNCGKGRMDGRRDGPCCGNPEYESTPPGGHVRNPHPTVKPLALMRYLVRLITPPGGLILDPFMGSGSTLIAAAQEGFDSVGVDLAPSHIPLAANRIRGNLGMLADVEVI